MFGSRSDRNDAVEPAAEREIVDATSHGIGARGRGASTLNPGNRFENVRLHVLGDFLDEQIAEHPDGVQVKTQVLRDATRTIINRVADSPDIPYEWTINPYRGCEHGCIYCYARPGHEYLGMSSGLDFETKIMAKVDAPQLLRRELASPKWQGEPIIMSGVTDPYQPIESKLRITRGCLEVMNECKQPVSIITKNALVLRDLDLLAEMAGSDAASVAVSMTTLDKDLARKMEPRASSPERRLQTVRELSQAGIPVTVMVAPIIPAINESEIPRILEAAADAGARSAGWVLLRLPYQIKALFLEWLVRHFPDRASKVEAFIREMRGGELYDSRFGKRQKGEGTHAKMIGDLFKMYKKKYGLDKGGRGVSSKAFRRPALDGQLGLFDR